jgi:nitrogen fixation protein NifX
MTQPSYRVAFATADMESVDQHFGSARAFAIYEVSGEHSVMSEVVEFGRLAQDGNEDKLEDKLRALNGCDAVYCLAIGGSALRRLVSVGVGAMKVDKGTPIGALLSSVRETLRRGELPWPACAAPQRSADPGRFERMEAEGWEE